MPTKRPAADEFAPYYARYIDRVPTGHVVDFLRSHAQTFGALLAQIPRDRETYAYAPGKWTIRELLLHVIDTERVMSYRALSIGRGDATPLPGFDENVWAPESGANARSLIDLTAEFAAVRGATIALLNGLPAVAWSRRGTASNNPVSTRGLAYIIAGHAIHHEGILRERYLGAS
ncbi:MAG TPA: DinB family protein [Gemmatimonadaceae bacterium]|nr:DinB family protein [Gemmatimonadaceae bacterium]